MAKYVNRVIRERLFLNLDQLQRFIANPRINPIEIITHNGQYLLRFERL